MVNTELIRGILGFITDPCRRRSILPGANRPRSGLWAEPILPHSHRVLRDAEAQNPRRKREQLYQDLFDQTMTQRRNAHLKPHSV